MTKLDSQQSKQSRPEKQVNAEQKRPLFSIIFGNRVVWIPLILAGGLIIFKISDSKGENNELDLLQPHKDVKVTDPPKPQFNPQELLRNLKANHSKPKEPGAEAPETDECSGVGPDPEENESNLDDEKKLTATLFLSLPFDELQETIQETGFDELYEIKDYFNVVANLRDAIRYGKKEDIKKEALEALRVGSFWDTRESKFHRKYIRVRRKIIDQQSNGREKMNFIKETLVAIHHYIKILASY